MTDPKFDALQGALDAMGNIKKEQRAEKLDAIGDKAGGVLDSAMGAVGTFGPMIKNAGKGKSERMDDRGNLTHKVNTGGNIMGGAAAGAKIGSNFGPWGTVIGAGAGALAGGITSIVDKNNQPTLTDLDNKQGDFNMKLGVGSVVDNSTIPEQAQAARTGYKSINKTKPLEVEKDEIVLRPHGKTFKKVADFKGGKTHEEGGEPYTAQQGDVIIPGNKRHAVDQALRLRDWRRIESIRQTLPKDTGQGTAAKGISEVDTYKAEKSIRGAKTRGTRTNNIFGMNELDTQNLIYHKLRANGYSDQAAKAMVVNLSHESAMFTSLEEFVPNAVNTKGYGLAQWTNSGRTPRRDKMVEWVQENNKNINNPEHQLDWLIHEIDNFKDIYGDGMKGGFNKDKLNSDTDVTSAAKRVLTDFENPRLDHQTDEHLQTRMGKSQTFLDQESVPFPSKGMSEGNYGEYKYFSEQQNLPVKDENWYNKNVVAPRTAATRPKDVPKLDTVGTANSKEIIPTEDMKNKIGSNSSTLLPAPEFAVPQKHSQRPEYRKGTSGVNVDEDPPASTDGNWETAYQFVKKAEGKISTDRKDTGNYAKIGDKEKSTRKKFFVGTRYGLTFDTWVTATKQSTPKNYEEFLEMKKEFEKTDVDDVKGLFKSHFWDRNKLGGIEDPKTATQIFDAAVNSGWFTETSSKNNVNTSLGIQGGKSKDDIIDKINAKVEELGSDVANDRIAKQRTKKYVASKSWEEHGKGWINNRVAPFVSDESIAGIEEQSGIKIKNTHRFTDTDIVEGEAVTNQTAPQTSEYEAYQAMELYAGRTPKDEEWFEANKDTLAQDELDKANATGRERAAEARTAMELARQDQAAIDAAKPQTERDNYWATQTALRHRGTAKGKAAVAKNIEARKNLGQDQGRIEAVKGKGFWDDPVDKIWAGSEWLTSNAMNAFALGGSKVQQALTGEGGLEDMDELKFEDTPEGEALKKEYQDVILGVIDDEETFSLAGLTDSANIISKYTSNIVGGQSTSGTDLYRGANMLSMYDEDTIESVREQLIEKGVSPEGMYLFEDMVASPQNYYSSNIAGAEAMDVLSLLVNPKGAIKGALQVARKTPQVLRGTGRTLKAGVDNAIPLAKQSAIWTKKKAKAAIKILKETDWKTAGKKMWDGLDRFLEEAPMYAEGEDMMDVLNQVQAAAVQSDAPEAVALATKATDYKKMWDTFKTKGKAAGNAVTELFAGSTFADLKKYKEQMKATTGLEWDKIKTMTKGQIARAAQAKMEPLEKEFAAIGKRMKEYNSKLKKKQQDYIDIVEADGWEQASKSPEAMAIQSEMDEIAKRMDDLNIMGEKVRSKIPLAFDEQGNWWNATIHTADGRQVPGTEKLTELHGKITKIMDDANGLYQQKDKIREAKTTEAFNALRKEMDAAIEKGGKIITKEHLRGARGMNAEKLAKGREITSLEELRKSFPNAYNKLAQADRLKDIPKDALGFRTMMAQLANEEPEFGIDAEYFDDVYTGDETMKVVKGAEDTEDVEPPTIGSEDGEGISGIVTPYSPGVKKESKEGEVAAGTEETKPTIGERLSGGFDALASYAPAMYNMVKGLEKADKVNRRFVKPQTREFQPMAQPQLNAIDNAFEAAIGNARNLSGGLASNFRSNTEKAWADKIARTGQVNAQEALRADQVAGENITAINRAREFNTQAASQYDQIDMQSEAATNAFLAQGVQDVANIGSRNRKDAAMGEREKTALKFMETNNFKWDEESQNFIHNVDGAGTTTPAKKDYFSKLNRDPLDINLEVPTRKTTNWLNTDN